MKFKFENLGYIDNGEITPGNLTIIAGNNNLGKTYINYAIYGFLYQAFFTSVFIVNQKYLKELVDFGSTKIDLSEFADSAQKYIDDFSRDFSTNIYEIFSTNEDSFKNSLVSLELLDYKLETDSAYQYIRQLSSNESIKVLKEEKSTIVEFLYQTDDKKKHSNSVILSAISHEISNLLFHNKLCRPFIITSERTGVSLFYKELDINKNALIELIAKDEKINPFEFFSATLARYALSIKHNIDIIRDFENIQKSKSFLQKDKIEDYLNISKKISGILNGSFKIIEKQIFFEPKKERNRKKVDVIPIYLTSSATKSLLLLDIYLKSIAQTNDVLMIDEPELNLHPSNQIIMARILANLVNLGINIMITTHSDYIIKELNNLIMLSNDFKNKDELIKKYNYDTIDILKPEQVKAYFIEKHTINEAKIDDFGIDLELFDDTIYNLNKVSEDIYFSIKG